MPKYGSTNKPARTPRRFPPLLLWIFIVTAFLLFASGVVLPLAVRALANTGTSPVVSTSQQGNISAPTQTAKQLSGTTPAVNAEPGGPSGPSGTPMATQTPASTPTATKTATATATQTPATPVPTATQSTQAAQLGVFPLSQGGPLPVPESALQPTNIARVMLQSTLISIYAGSMTQNHQAGILCVLSENLTTGQLSLKMYQAPHPEGPLTILSIEQTTLKLTDTKTQGYFNLVTDQFQW